MSDVSSAILHQISWKNLQRLQDLAQWSDSEMADRLGYSLPQFLKNQMLRRPLNAAPVIQLANEVQVLPEDLLFGTLDFSALEKHFYGEQTFLPERYFQGAFSRRRTSLPMIAYCDQRFGAFTTDRILRKLQVRRAALTDPNQNISVHFPNDLCHEIAKLPNMKTEDFSDIGRLTMEVNSGSKVALLLGQSRNPLELYLRLVEEVVNLFDKNAFYRLESVDKNEVILEATENKEVLEALQVAHFDSSLTCLVRVGMLGNFTRFLDLPESDVTELSCVHNGDRSCRFRVNFSIPNKVQRSRSPAASLLSVVKP